MVFFVNDTATTEIYTLSPTRRSSDLGDDLHLLDDPVVQPGWLERTAEACGEVCGGPSEVLAVGHLLKLGGVVGPIGPQLGEEPVGDRRRGGVGGLLRREERAVRIAEEMRGGRDVQLAVPLDAHRCAPSAASGRRRRTGPRQTGARPKGFEPLTF